MRTAILALALALLAPTMALSQTAAWKTLSYPDLHMTLSAPADIAPKISHETIPAAGKQVPATIIAFLLPQYGDAGLQVMVMDFTGLGLQADVDAAARGVVAAAPDATQVSITPISFQGAAGRDISLHTGGRLFKERLIVMGARMYQMQTITAPGATAPLSETDRFVAGLTILP
ncbi:hypothetical protein [Phenylobacterium sp.]|uniref:hypothetical protein n=1 Tax=Phenylobacterium sp. TaxID=1871053 RepID=UPI002DE4E062|nr:hypothetical protein [Phenylobacterium sp.]